MARERGWVIHARAAGRRKPLLHDWSVPPPPGMIGSEDDTGGMPLRELIAHVVRNEVQQQRDAAERGPVGYMLAEEIERGRESGRVTPNQLPGMPSDADAAVELAWRSFDDGLYIVSVNDRLARHLDERVRLGTDAEICFVRLTMLTGG